jgi:hypoxanthine phosphoribosyltransferase
MSIIDDIKFNQMMETLYLRINIEYDYIIGLKRGGLVPAVYLSHKLNVPMLVADITHELSKGDNLDWHDDILPEIPPGSNILIVDDIIDSGYTLQKCAQHYTKNCYVDVAVLVAKTSSLIMVQNDVPNVIYAIEVPDDAPFIYYPWETKPEA